MTETPTDPPFRPSADDLMAANAAYAADFSDGGRAGPPTRQLAVVTCMDARVDPAALLGLGPGEAHVLRNAGGVVTDDTLRSLCLSQRALGTREVLVVHHTRCGLEGLDDEAFAAEVEADVGDRPPWPAQGFTEVASSVRRSVRRLADSPWLVDTTHIRGFVYDVDTGRLAEVTPEPG